MTAILLIGGSDSSCGAGLFADYETLLDLGSAAKTVTTSVTSQSDKYFFGSHNVPLDNLESQIDAIRHEAFGSVKIGMLPNPESVYLIGEFLRSLPESKVVLDPVLKSSSGGHLCSKDTITAIREVLFPFADLVTPNLHESKTFIGEENNATKDILEIAEACMKFIPHSLLLKGGHLEGALCQDVFIKNGAKPVLFQREKIKGATEIRGTGCRLATAIAHYYSVSSDLDLAVKKGVSYLQEYINRKLRLH